MFPAGVTSVTFSIRITDDENLELFDETFLLVINDLLLPKNITHGDFGSATVTIVSDEGNACL